LVGHTANVHSVAYSRDGAHVASSLYDATIRIWDLYCGPITGDSPNSSVGSVQATPRSSLNEHIAPFETPLASGNVANDLHSTWAIDKTGWVVTRNSKLLIWLPRDLKSVVLHPRNSVVMSRRGSLSLDFSKANIGELWQQCYQPTSTTRGS
jgi:WD40 repeat protein